MFRSRSRRRSPGVVALAAVLAVTASSIAFASLPADDGAITSASDTHGHNHAQHGSEGGHLNPVNRNLELIGRMRINQDQEGRASDVGVFRNHAYVGAFAEPRCQKGGVYVFDLTDPRRPKQVNFIRTGGNSYVGEGVQVINITTPQFSGDVLVMNNEICGPRQPSTVGGVSFVDVTDPKRHRMLAAGVGDVGPPAAQAGAGLAHASHSAFMWDAGDTAYAVIIDNEESADLDILDITDPRRPRLIAEYDLNADFPQIIDTVKGASESFSHDMVVKQIAGRWYMLASYWDGGYVILDVTDPTAPTLVGDSDFAAVDEQLLEAAGITAPPEGNAHQAEWTADNAHILGADEDFAPYLSTATAGSTPLTGAASGSGTPQLAEGATIAGTAVFVGRGCSGDPLPPGSEINGRVAVVERGLCTFSEKVANIDGAGDPVAILVFNRQGSDACDGTTGMSVDGNVPTFGVIPRGEGFAMFGAPYDLAACLAGTAGATPIALGATGPTVTFSSSFDGWGYLRLFDADPVGGKLTLLDTYAIPEAHDPGFATGFGDLSIHEVATSPSTPDLAYLAYYSGGLRVVRIVDGEITEVGHHIDVGGSNYWGVEVWTPTTGRYAGQELILASDRDFGVSVFRYTGEGAPAANRR